jgi:hypothetical protein
MEAKAGPLTVNGSMPTEFGTTLPLDLASWPDGDMSCTGNGRRFAGCRPKLERGDDGVEWCGGQRQPRQTFLHTATEQIVGKRTP